MRPTSPSAGSRPSRRGNWPISKMPIAGRDFGGFVSRALRPLHGEVPAAGGRQADLASKLADLGIKGNSHVLMQEKNTDDIAAVIYQWLEKAIPATK